MFGQVGAVSPPGDARDTLDLVRKAVLAAQLGGLQQNYLSGSDVTAGCEHVSIGNALDDVPLRCRCGAVYSFMGQAQGCCMVARVE
jgi:hypothetical protein